MHKSLGALIVPIIILRLLVRLASPPLPLPDEIPAIQQFAAHATHWALYALLLAQGLIGWIGTSAYPAPVPFFGWFNLPALWPENRALSDQLLWLHGWCRSRLRLSSASISRLRCIITSCARTAS